MGQEAEFRNAHSSLSSLQKQMDFCLDLNTKLSFCCVSTTVFVVAFPCAMEYKSMVLIAPLQQYPYGYVVHG